MKKDTINIFIFRRDLRFEDNSCLNLLHEMDPNTKILYIFIFNPEQINPNKNEYYSKNCVEFMIQSLHYLNNSLNNNLNYFEGKDLEILDKLLNIYNINYIGCNLDFTPYSRKRNEIIDIWCKQKKIKYITSEDYTLFPMKIILNLSNKPYEVFTPFYKKCLTIIKDIHECVYKKHNSIKIKVISDLIIVKNIDKYYNNEPNYKLAVKGGRSNALNIIVKGEFKNYDKNRNYPSLDGTTKLSAYLKFGCISIREFFYIIKKKYGINHGLIRELIWREFYANITWNFPRVLQGQIKGSNMAFKLKYNDIPWKYDEIKWNALITGHTGYPLVDAGIRCLISTGWTHNRCRMIIASFAAKDLMIPPNNFERWFATKLVDYDCSSNSGGVQWCYSIGCDSQPFYRIFNPFLQSKRFDQKAEYIKKWIPELKNIPASIIHNWDIEFKNYKHINYIPIINHKEQSIKIKSIFKALT